ncbi:transcription factor TFIIIB component B'' [Vanessa cardui]|uniref:transcription factor TFIIIB component B'' n=1 Tax=Vanessa cardui TaxID=171605 RepID=UPI001F1420F3|nr:transcription factor TFIIIB component B'' [Vanessa cardui]
MSTRRARIKAVTSLPPRRKNNETADSKNKPPPTKEITEKVARSPRTPKVNTTLNQEQNVTPYVKSTSDSQIISGKTTPIKVVKTPRARERTPLLTDTNESPRKESSSTLPTDKSLPNANLHVKSNLDNVFASPLRRDSPKRTFASPIVPSPKINKSVDLSKTTTPQKNIPTPVAQKITENNELQIADSVVSNINHNRSKKKHGGQDNSPSIEENLNEEAMDGIVPLQPANTIHKPIDLLKNEIISENAEVLFDPIVPLPSPSKVRPKLRPAPRLGPYRRNSVQGSASESEDESRRNLLASSTSRQRHDSHTSHSTHQSLSNRDVSRVRNDSVCSSVSQVATQPAPPGSPLKEKQNNKAKRQETSRRMTTMRRRRENVKRDALTMYDLIFYNPTSNPIVPDEDEINIKEANVKEEMERTKKTETVEPEPQKDQAAPVPQIKLGPKGEIILDEESLVINQTNSGRAVSSVVHEGAWGSSNGYKYKRGPRTAEWSAAETVRFYRALAAIGTDFTLMAPLFPDRTRKELKLKFKKEEKLNGAQVDKALRAKVPWDVMKLKDEFREERVAAVARAERERERVLAGKRAERQRVRAARELRVRQSKGAKALESTMLPGITGRHNHAITAEDIIERAKCTPLKRKSNAPDTDETPSKLNLATLTPLSKANKTIPTENENMATISKLNTPNLQVKTPEIINGVPQLIPSNIENGSLVVLTVNDPTSSAKKMFQTYIAHGSGQLTPIALPSTLLNSVVGYMAKNTSLSSPQILSPSSVASHDSRTSNTPSGITVLPSPTKKQRHNSFTITQL